MGDKIQLFFKVVKMKISIRLYFLYLTSMSSFAQFIGTSGGFSGLLGFSGDFNYGALGRRKRSTIRISAEPDTVLTSWKSDTEEISPVLDTLEIFNESDTMVSSQEPDNVKISREPDEGEPEYPYLVSFPFPSFNQSSFNQRSVKLFPFGLSFPWFSYSSSIEHSPEENSSAESEDTTPQTQDTAPKTSVEESTLPESQSLYSVLVPAWFQSLSPTNVSLHKVLFPFGSSFPFGGR